MVQFNSRRASILFWHNLSHPCYDSIFWREKGKLCQAKGLHTPSRLVFSLRPHPQTISFSPLLSPVLRSHFSVSQIRQRYSWPNTLPSYWILSTLHMFSVLYFILIPTLYSFCFLPFLAFPLLFWPFLTCQPLSDINAQAGSVITHLKFVFPSRIFLYNTYRPCKETYLKNFL